MISSVSTRAINFALQRSMQTMQRELLARQKEVQTGTVADVGARLGARSAVFVSLQRDADRMDAILETNKLAATRLTATQDSLSALQTASQSLVAAFAAARGNPEGLPIAAEASASLLGSIVSISNTTVSGQHIFSGVNTDAAPIKNGDGIPAGSEMDAAFVGYFGFSKTDALASAITPSAFLAFAETQIEPVFFGADWSSVISTASDVNVHSRISLTETATTSVTANETGFRNLFYAAALSANFLSSSLNSSAKDGILDQAMQRGAAAGADIGKLQAKTGLVQQRLAEADTKLTVRRDLSAKAASDLTSVDPFEAAAKLNSLLTQIETTYALTRKIQDLSILRYLG